MASLVASPTNNDRCDPKGQRIAGQTGQLIDLETADLGVAPDDTDQKESRAGNPPIETHQGDLIARDVVRVSELGHDEIERDDGQQLQKKIDRQQVGGKTDPHKPGGKK
jgi:hypothetical protein